MIFWWTLGRSKKTKDLARTRFERVIEAVYDPAFFEKAGIPDTIDGRFQVVGMFVALEMKLSSDKKDNQALFDHFFMNCEMGLREMGIGDVGIPKKLHKMMKAFHGHAEAYYQALATNNWDQVITDNIFGTVDTPPNKAHIKTIADRAKNYMKDYVDDQEHAA